MPIESRQAGDYRVLALSGDIRGQEDDFLELRREGHQALAEHPFLALDCRGITFVDSQTLGLMVGLLSSAQAREGEVVLLGVTERVSRWFSLSGLDRLFRMLPDESDLAGEAAIAGGAGGTEGRRAALESVNIDQMVEELQSALGEADESGDPQPAKPVENRMLSEIEKLLEGPEPEGE